MRRLVVNSGGMGAAAPSLPAGPTLTSPGWQNACGVNYGSYLFNVDCWGYSYTDWQNAFYAQAGTLTIPTPAAIGTPSSALTDPNAVLGDTTGQISQDLSNQQISQTQQSLAAQNPPGASATDSCMLYTGISCTWLLVAAGVGLIVIARLL